MIIGTAGHIDHGKTSLVRALTGVDTDRTPAERARGITIELGFAPLTLSETTSSIVDVPGHEAFVRTMVAGAVGIDVALFVVAADDGVRPQTREHLAILRLLGVTRAVVVLTKCDRVEAARIADVDAEVRALLRREHAVVSDAPIIPVSVVTGAGLDALRTALEAEATAVRARASDPLVRLPIDRVLTVPGTGTVVTGTVWSGRVAVGDTLRLVPRDVAVRVRGLHRHGVRVTSGDAGERLAVAISGVAHTDVTRGDLLVVGDGWQASRVLRADVELLADVPDVLTPRTRVRVHIGTREVGARVVARGGVAAGAAGAGPQPVRIMLDDAVVARGGERFVLRRPSPAATIGGGVVTDAAPTSGRVRPFAAPALSAAARLSALAHDAKLAGVVASTLAVRLGELPPPPDDVVTIGDRLISRDALADAERRLMAFLRDWHAAHPTATGAPLTALPEVLHGPPSLVRSVLSAVAGVTVEANAVRLATFRPSDDPVRTAAAAALLRHLESAGVTMPSVKELAVDHGPGTEALLRRLRTDGATVLVGQDRWTTPAVVRQVAQRLADQLIPLRDYTASEIREMFGVSRKYLIPWLEYCDREGITLRHGDVRRLGARARRVADGLA